MKKNKTEKSCAFDRTAAAAVALLREYVGDAVYFPIPGHPVKLTAESIEARAVVGPFVEISIGSLAIIATVDRLQQETQNRHIDPWRRLFELSFCLPHHWRAVAYAVEHELQKADPEKRAEILAQIDSIEGGQFDPAMIARATR